MELNQMPAKRARKLSASAIANRALHARHDPFTIALIPAYNEDRFIGSIVLKTIPYVDLVIVVDDGSTDMTARVATAAGAVVVRHEHNQGKSAALNTALAKAREMIPDIVIVLDGDGQHDPKEIPQLVLPLLGSDVDMVVGSRFLRAGLNRRNQIPGWRRFGQHALTGITNLLSGLPLTDSQSGYRAFSQRAIMELEFRQTGFAAESEMQFLARERGFRIVEVPIGVTYEEPPKRNPLAQALQVIHGIMQVVGQSRPLFFFGVLGLFLMTAAGALAVWIVILYQEKQQLATGYALIMVLLMILGSIALFTGIILHSIRGLLLQLLARAHE